MRIALLDFHRVKNKKIEETIKISEVLKESGADLLGLAPLSPVSALSACRILMAGSRYL